MTVSNPSSDGGGLDRTRRSRVPSHRSQRGELLFRDTFQRGGRPSYCGWRDHFGGDTTTGKPVMPISVTRYPEGSEGYALKLSTPDRAYTALVGSLTGYRGTSAYKNLSRSEIPSGAGLVSLSAFLTHQSGREAFAWGSYGLAIDTQAFDNSWRSFAQVTCYDLGYGQLPRWSIKDNASGMQPLPASIFARGHEGGVNQNKYNWDYVELVWDLNANSGKGGYRSLQVNDQYVDLTSAASIAAGIDQTWRGDEATQGSSIIATATVDSAARYLDFRGGLNFGITMAMTTSNANAYPAAVFARDVTVTVYDA